MAEASAWILVAAHRPQAPWAWVKQNSWQLQTMSPLATSKASLSSLTASGDTGREDIGSAPSTSAHYLGTRPLTTFTSFLTFAFPPSMSSVKTGGSSYSPMSEAMLAADSHLPSSNPVHKNCMR